MLVQAAIAAGAGAALIYTARTYRLSRRGQDNERFSRGLERLGSEELYVRIGGIHALEHVLRDSPDHHDNVIELLVAFIRQRTPPRRRELVGRSWQRLRTDVDGVPESRGARVYEPPVPAPLSDSPEPVLWWRTFAPGDVQAALTVLGRLPLRSSLVRPDLSGLDLQHMELYNADLSFINLSQTDLRRLYAYKAEMRGADLMHADLRHGFLVQTDLRDASVAGADLRSAKLPGADLRGATLDSADLRDAGFDAEEMLLGSDIPDADLEGATLWDTDLRAVDLRRTRGLTARQLNAAKLNEHTQLPRHLRWDAGTQKVVEVDVDPNRGSSVGKSE
ncbi:pentapeptide repeat-containing protein [Streptomyces platensis]